MIVAVEGPSAAGKTSWCRANAADFVAEHTPVGNKPDAEQPARFWTGVNSQRWSNAIELETATGTAICDSDPLKLHYSWCMSRIAATPPERFRAELTQARLAIQQRRLGLADAVVVLAPGEDQLRSRKGSDTGRIRRSFDLHIQLRGPLIEWYTQLDSVARGHVAWNAQDLSALGVIPPRADRYDVNLFDEFIHRLPAL